MADIIMTVSSLDGDAKDLVRSLFIWYWDNVFGMKNLKILIDGEKQDLNRLRREAMERKVRYETTNKSNY